MATAQVRREFALLVAESAEVDDALHTRPGSGRAEDFRGAAIAHLEIVCGAHRVDQVVRRRHATHRCRNGRGIPHVATGEFGGRRTITWEQRGAPQQTANAQPFGFEEAEQPPTDVAGGASEQDPFRIAQRARAHLAVMRALKSQLARDAGLMRIAISDAARASSQRANGDSRVPR